MHTCIHVSYTYVAADCIQVHTYAPSRNVICDWRNIGPETRNPCRVSDLGEAADRIPGNSGVGMQVTRSHPF